MQQVLSHTIEIDHRRKLVDVRISGILTPEDVAWIGEEIRAAVRTFGALMGQHVTLYDVSGVKAATSASIDMVKSTFSNPAVRETWSRKIAVVASKALVRMQAQRVREARPDLVIFDRREAALEWLLRD